MPSVLRPGKTLELTGIDENPVLVDSFGFLIPEKTKSSTVTRDEFLHERKMDESSDLGMQKSCTGSESEAETENIDIERRVTNQGVIFRGMFDFLGKIIENKKRMDLSEWEL